MKGVNSSSIRKLVYCFAGVSLLGTLLFYWVCQMNYVSYSSKGYIFLLPKLKVNVYWMDDMTKQKLGYTNSSHLYSEIDVSPTINSTKVHDKFGIPVEMNNSFMIRNNLSDLLIPDFLPPNNADTDHKLELRETMNYSPTISNNVSHILIRDSRISLSTEGIYKYHNISCVPLHPFALLYNRIFKTGSSSVSKYMEKISSPLNYTVDVGTTEDWYKTGDPYPYPDIIPRHVGQSELRISFVAHFFFRRRLNITKQYTYINIVREPIQRIVSHYKYMRTLMRPTYRIMEIKKAGQWNESLMDCVTNEHRGCESNVMTRFLCGTRSFCKTGSTEALRVAKSNAKRYYAAIGLQENLPLFLSILKRILPDFFDYGDMKLDHVKETKSKDHFRNIPFHVIELIKKKNSADIELYDFLRTKFWDQVKACRKTN